MFCKTTIHCPACQSSLRFAKEDGTVLVRCENPRCPSALAQDGIKGVDRESPNQLAMKLVETLNSERDWEG